MTTAESIQEQALEANRQLVAGRFRVQARIGHGRLGMIYEAVDEEYRVLGVAQPVAIQLLGDRAARDRELLGKLDRGYTVLRAVSHPNIVPFLDFGHDGQFAYLAMALLDGASLRRVLDDATTLPLEEVMPVVRAVGDALGLLHANSMVHGRLTASSVFITENLEVRLLDIVPLDASATILRGVASNDTLSRCDVRDDIYAIACIAYEMLAGRHPFNFQNAAEARMAGLEPARIESLPDRQWDAICRGLSFNREVQFAAVADFLRAFGITGNERIPVSDVAAAEQTSSPKHAATDIPPAGRLAAASHSAPAPVQVADTTPVRTGTASAEALDAPGKKRSGSRRMPSPLLLVVLAGLIAWYTLSQPGDDIAGLIAYVDSYRDDRAAATGDDRLRSRPENLVPAAVRDTEPALLSPGAVKRSAEKNETDAETTGETPEPEAEASSPAVSTQPIADDAAPAAAVDTGMPDATPNADDLARTPNAADAAESASEAGLIQSLVTVSERDGAARITTRRPNAVAGRLVWWTSNQTAVAGEDYIPIDQPVPAFASGEEAETIHIPLVNDSLPEQTEAFFVYLGRHDASLGRLEPISSVRVVINDDE